MPSPVIETAQDTPHPVEAADQSAAPTIRLSGMMVVMMVMVMMVLPKRQRRTCERHQ
jgi:hypothetical protein